MDALTTAAINSLLKEIFPKLEAYFKANPTAEALSPEILPILTEAIELLGMVQQRASGQTPASAPTSDDMSDDEALKLLAAMDGTAPADDEETELMDDEAAAEMLRMMDEPAPKATMQTTATTPSAPAELAHSEHDESGSEDDFGEIDEWTPNDFQTDPDMVNDFNTNSDELMQSLDEAILKLEEDPTNKEIIEEIFRAAHTIKGAAGMFGFKALERIMHRLENLFDLIRKDKLVATSAIVDVVFSGMDTIRALLEAVKQGKPCGLKTGHIVESLAQAAKGKAVAIPKPAKAPAASSAGDGAGHDDHGDQGDKGAKKNENVSTIRVDLKRLDTLVNLVGELVIDRTRFASIEETLRARYPKIKMLGNLSETVQLFGRHMNEFQDIIMKVRMVPIGNAFNRFGRIVRDLAKSLDKDIRLHISGENAELDKTLVEQIGDPLIHLIRNACDHGIETPDLRTSTGKTPTGNVYLSAHQEGNQIVIKIRDDGKGMNPDIIRKKGIEKGLIKEEDVLSQREIYNLIFEPGFSTAEKVSNISGRGVGMDVVKKQIMKLKGMLEVDSEVGKGSTVTIRLPLTLAIVQSLLVGVMGETLAIPLSSVIESIRISPQEIQRVGEAEVIRLRDKVLPLMHLEEVLDLGSKQGSLSELLATHRKERDDGIEKFKKKTSRLFVVVVGHAERPFGIVVDQLLTQQEMVIKSMGQIMKDIPCIAGGAVLGNGEVVLVLDIPELEDIFTSKKRRAA
jgi:two-component system chemotaxis sensor kinase CheA